MCNHVDFATFHDKRLRRALNELQVRCTYQKRGCTWTGELGKLDNHLNCDDGCKFANIDHEFSIDARMPSKNNVKAHMEEQHIQPVAKKFEGKERDIESELQKSNELKEDFSVVQNLSAEVRNKHGCSGVFHTHFYAGNLLLKSSNKPFKISIYY